MILVIKPTPGYEAFEGYVVTQRKSGTNLLEGETHDLKPKYPVQAWGVTLSDPPPESKGITKLANFEAMVVHYDLREGVYDALLIDVMDGADKYLARRSDCTFKDVRVIWPGAPSNAIGERYQANYLEIE